MSAFDRRPPDPPLGPGRVAPRLLVAVGVRGDFEELTGFVKANVVAAVSADRGEPMVSAADVAVIGDWREALPALLATL